MVGKNDIVLVDKATSNQGNAISRLLLQNGFRVRALTHQPESQRAALLAAKGAQIVHGDLDNSKFILKALNNVTAVFAVQSSRTTDIHLEERREKHLAYLAKEKNIKQYVFSSVATANTRSKAPYFEAQSRIERMIKALRFPSHTFLRGTFFMESLLDPNIFPELYSAGKLVCPIKPSTRVQMISAEDVAKFALYAFKYPSLTNGIELDLAGDEHTFADIAYVLSKALAKPIEFTPMNMEEFVHLRQLSSGLHHNIENIRNFWNTLHWDIDIGGLMLASRNCGIELRTLKEWAVSLTKLDSHSRAHLPTHLPT